MSITLEQIDQLRGRANVSYQDAKAALEECNGDLVEALVYLEKQNKVKSTRKLDCENKFFDGIKNLIQKGNKTRFIIRSKESDVINLPVTVTLLIAIFATPIFLIGALAALLTNHKLRIESQECETDQINKVFDKVSNAVNHVKEECATEKQEK